MTYGTFDLLHYGHIELLRRARALGDHLVVGLSTDEFNAVKGKTARFPYCDRQAMLQAVRYVDLVVPEATWEQKTGDVASYGIDVVAMGEDWRGAFDDELEGLCELVYLPRTPEVSTTRIKDHLLGAPLGPGPAGRWLPGPSSGRYWSSGP